MTTLLILRDSKGKFLSKCDEKCYNANLPKCDCACGGRNHGVGLNQALKNLKDFPLSAQIPYLPHDHDRQTFLHVPGGVSKLLQPTLF